jgi:hypothetical protein
MARQNLRALKRPAPACGIRLEDEAGGRSAILYSELWKNSLETLPDCPRFQTQNFADLCIRFSTRDPEEHLDLALGQLAANLPRIDLRALFQEQTDRGCFAKKQLKRESRFRQLYNESGGLPPGDPVGEPTG